jgi:uncharacterized membrane protein (UPF0127 family)
MMRFAIARSARTAILAATIALPAMAAFADCEVDRVDLRGDWGQAGFTVDVADTNATRAKGLMNVPSMPMGQGMLFVYETPQRATFWMRNTLIPLDMIFAAPDGTVTRVHENARPLDETTIDGGDGVQFVLEINGGLAGALGIAPGTVLRHPAIPQADAAWPCGE